MSLCFTMKHVWLFGTSRLCVGQEFHYKNHGGVDSMRNLRTVSQITEWSSKSSGVFRQGDVISLLDKSSEASSDLRIDYYVLLVHRMLVWNDTEPRVFLVLLPKRHLRGMMNFSAIGVVACAFKGLTVDCSGRDSDYHSQCRLSASCAGYLEDGTRYFVHKVLLYSDDFQGYTSRKGSYGGVYMLPLTEIGAPEYTVVLFVFWA